MANNALSRDYQLMSCHLHSQPSRHNLQTLSMVGLGEMPSGDGDFFIFNGDMFTSISPEIADTTAPFVINENKIVISYPDRVEKLNVTELTSDKMVFILEVYKGDKKMSADNVIFTLGKHSEG